MDLAASCPQDSAAGSRLFEGALPLKISNRRDEKLVSDDSRPLHVIVCRECLDGLFRGLELSLNVGAYFLALADISRRLIQLVEQRVQTLEPGEDHRLLGWIDRHD
jgi:hypothetical protein